MQSNPLFKQLIEVHITGEEPVHRSYESIKRMFKCSLERMTDKYETFRQFGLQEDGSLIRYALSEEDNLARAEFVKRMEGLGATIEMDDMANMYATIAGSDPTAKRLCMGSHTDSVKNGGHFDGILGVLAAMEVLETIVKEDIPHKHPVTAMIFTNEEGSLYQPAMMASGVVFDFFDEATMLSSKSVLDKTSTFGQALKDSIYTGRVDHRMTPDKYQGFLELHVEQGPILEEASKDIGVVTCVLGMVNYRIRTYGQSDHAGTTPMKNRKDALYAASKLLQYLHDALDQLDSDLVYTTGEIVCHPCVHTVIPDFVDFCIDARHESKEVIEQVVKIIKDIPKEVVGCTTSYELAWGRETKYFDETLVKYVKESAEELGFSHMFINSGAGHDAQYVASQIPTTMVFSPSKDGHSHCNEEYTSIEQCTAGASVMLGAIMKMD